MTETTPPHRETALEAELQAVTQTHFQQAKARIPDIYERHFGSLAGVYRRHGRAWRDVPRDLLSLPRLLFSLFRYALRWPPKTPGMSLKERELLQVLELELLDLEGWQQKLLSVTEQYAQTDSTPYEHSALTPESRACLKAYLEGEMSRIALPREGARDVLMFALIGAGGQALSDSVTFGSALALGTALATTLYFSSTSWWESLWYQWIGLPEWVSYTGMAGGIFLAMLLSPLIAPISEWLINRFRGPRFLEQWLAEIETELLRPRRDSLDRAGPLASLSQLLPDLLALLKQIR